MDNQDIIESRDRYEYETIKRPLDEIRVLRLLPGNAECIECTLQIVRRYQFTTPDHDFIAVSYTWAPEMPKHGIVVNGKMFEIGHNLWLLLNTLRSESNLGFDSGSSLWIDQLCINQSNQDEKLHQVSQMGKIYSCAALVLAWLGPATDPNVSYAVHQINTYASNETTAAGDVKFSAGLQAICAKPFWNRVWIVQEMWFARDVQFLSGNQAFNRATFELVLNAEATKFSFPRNVKTLVLEKSSTSNRMHAEKVIMRYIDFQCTLIHDKVLALNGLMLDPIRAIYGWDPVRLYLHVSHSILRNRTELSIRSYRKFIKIFASELGFRDDGIDWEILVQLALGEVNRDLLTTGVNSTDEALATCCEQILKAQNGFWEHFTSQRYRLKPGMYVNKGSS